jgi:signal transduction histidine kinase
MNSSADLLASPGDEVEDNEVAQLRAEVARLRAQVMARDNLLAVAAHELRNPMHTILLLVRAALTIARRDQMEQLVPKLERIRHVVDTYVKRATLLLDSVRLEASAWATDRSEVDLVAVVREIAASYDPEAQYAGSRIWLDMPASLRGRWDRLAVEQIVGNLLSNAIKYGGGGPVHVQLDSHDAQARLKVRDHGAGIPDGDQSRIFERFQQAIGTGHKRSGFGIGLWLVKSLVDAHGGTIAVQSRLGEGSTFTVLLPGLLEGTDG